jgi:hypothetical protein
MKSWKTTLFGSLTLIGTLGSQFYPQYAHHGAFLAALATGLGLIFSRDNNVSSEQLGIAPKPVEPPKP